MKYCEKGLVMEIKEVGKVFALGGGCARHAGEESDFAEVISLLRINEKKKYLLSVDHLAIFLHDNLNDPILDEVEIA
jgi:hypothetical protein